MLRPGPSILSPSSQADTGRQFFFSFYSLYAYPFVNRLAYHLYHIRPATYQKRSVHIRHTLLRTAEIWIFVYFMKAVLSLHRDDL